MKYSDFVKIASVYKRAEDPVSDRNTDAGIGYTLDNFPSINSGM